MEIYSGYIALGMLLVNLTSPEGVHYFNVLPTGEHLTQIQCFCFPHNTAIRIKIQNNASFCLAKHRLYKHLCMVCILSADAVQES